MVSDTAFDEYMHVNQQYNIVDRSSSETGSPRVQKYGIRCSAVVMTGRNVGNYCQWRGPYYQRGKRWYCKRHSHGDCITTADNDSDDESDADEESDDDDDREFIAPEDDDVGADERAANLIIRRYRYQMIGEVACDVEMCPAQGTFPEVLIGGRRIGYLAQNSIVFTPTQPR